jgi:hypothetical protein
MRIAFTGIARFEQRNADTGRSWIRWKGAKQMKAMPVALLEWKKVEKNTLRGFAKIRMGKALIVRDVSVHTSHGKRWASLPSKPVLNPDGTHKKDTGTGKPVYVPILEWADRDTADSFSEGVIQAVEAQYPGDTGA